MGEPSGIADRKRAYGTQGRRTIRAAFRVSSGASEPAGAEVEGKAGGDQSRDGDKPQP